VKLSMFCVVVRKTYVHDESFDGKKSTHDIVISLHAPANRFDPFCLIDQAQSSSQESTEVEVPQYVPHRERVLHRGLFGQQLEAATQTREIIIFSERTLVLFDVHGKWGTYTSANSRLKAFFDCPARVPVGGTPPYGVASCSDEPNPSVVIDAQYQASCDVAYLAGLSRGRRVSQEGLCCYVLNMSL